MVRILLIRHGFSISNKSGCLTGRLDVPLDEKGERQAELLAEYLIKNYSIDAIYSSDLIRVIDTVRPLALKLCKEINALEGLRETHIGRWQGKRISELAESEPELVEQMKEDPYNFKFPDGECENDVFLRVSRTLDSITRENDGHTVVVATHGGVIRSLLRQWMKVSPDRTDLIPLVNNASVSVIEYEKGIYTPKIIGFDGYLDGLSTAYDFK